MKYAVCICLLITLAYVPARGQRYPVRMYTLRDGLPQMQINATLLDSRGYIWLGTQNGLTKFDGEQFETFTRHDPGIGSALIRSIAEDSYHHIWLLTENGLIRFDGATFYPHPLPKSIESNNSPIQIDNQNRIWLIASNQLYVFQQGHYTPASAFIIGIDSLVVTSIRWDHRSKRLWLTGTPSSNRLYYLSGNQCYSVPDYASPAGHTCHIIPDNGPPILRESDELGHTRYLLLNPEQPPTPFLQLANGQGVVLNPAPIDFYGMANTTGTIFKYNRNTYSLEKLYESTGNLSYTGAMMRPGKVYFGTDKGLIEIFDNGMRYFDEQQAPYVWSVAERPNGDIWLLNYGPPPQRFVSKPAGQGALLPLDEPSLRMALARERPTQQSLWNRYYYHPVQDQQGTLYLPHETGPIAYTAKESHFLTKSTDGTALSLYHDPRTDRIFVGMPGGFWVFQQGKLIRKITAAEGFHECLYGLCAIADTEPDVYWLGSGRGLVRYNFRTQQLTNLSETNGKLPTLGVLDLCQDTNGNIWMATRDGLCRYNRRTDQIIRVAPELLNNPVKFVGLLTDSTLAIGDTYGIYLLDLKAFHQSGRTVMRLLNHRTGYVGIEPGQAGFYKDRQGRAWITSSTILSYIDTRLFAHQPAPLRPIIRNLNGQRLPFAYTDSVFSIAGNQHTVRIGFEVLGDNRPTQTQYAWQLDDGPWSGWQPEPYIILREYGSGTHTFRLKARSGGLNEDHEQTTTLLFRASILVFETPAFRRFLPFILFCLLVLGVVLFVFVVSSRQQVRRAKQQLVEREKASLFLNVQTLQSQLNTHFMFNVLVPLQNLILKNKPDEAARLLVEFSNLVRSFLNSSAIGNGGHKATSLIEREITLAEEITLLERYVRFEQLLYRDKIRVHFDANSLDGKLNPDTVTLPPMLIQPFVENAIKHGLVHKAELGNLWIRFVGVDETLICTIEDDGIGRDQMRHIHQTSNRAYKSLGSDLVQQRVDTLNQLGYDIRIRTDDRQAGGTVVTITIARTEFT